jgi:hypothetical protein
MMSGRNRDKYRSHPSGYQKNKREREREESIKKQKGSFLQYLTIKSYIATGITSTTTNIATNFTIESSITSTILTEAETSITTTNCPIRPALRTALQILNVPKEP